MSPRIGLRAWENLWIALGHIPIFGETWSVEKPEKSKVLRLLSRSTIFMSARSLLGQLPESHLFTFYCPWAAPGVVTLAARQAGTGAGSSYPGGVPGRWLFRLVRPVVWLVWPVPWLVRPALDRYVTGIQYVPNLSNIQILKNTLLLPTGWIYMSLEL